MSKDKIIVEYIWLDNYSVKQIRNKTRIIEADTRKYSSLSSYIGNIPRTLTDKDLSIIPTWTFKGIHTNQDDICILKPIRLYKDITIENGYIALCEVYNDDNTPHKSNNRHNINNINSKTNIKQDFIISNELIKYNDKIEQNNNKYYSIGKDNRFGKNIIDQHIKMCLDTSINYVSVYQKNYEGFWKYEIYSNDLITAIDDLWVSIYLLYRISENNKLYLKTGFMDNLDVKTTLIVEDNKYEMSTYKTDFYNLLSSI